MGCVKKHTSWKLYNEKTIVVLDIYLKNWNPWREIFSFDRPLANNPKLIELVRTS